MSKYGVVIVGGGVFGLSAAFALAQGTYRLTPERVLVIDRSSSPPEQDAASSDLNKIVRGDYADPTYAELALAALEKWNTDEDWKQHFHKSGIIVASSELGSHGEAYLTGSRNTQQILFEAGRQESGPVDLQSDESFEAALGLKTPRHGVTRPPLAYSNKASGWADSRGALDTMAQKCREAGVSFAAGQVNQLIIENGDVRGARLKEGEEYYADDLVILAAGSWSPAVFPELKDAVTATGQVLATIQLTAEEADEYSRTPVYIDMQTGFYSFPPNSDNVVKFAFHHRGYTNEQPSLADANTFVSTPRTGHFGGSLDEQIPKASVIALRQALAKVYPALAKKPFAGTRLCWYADSTDCDFIIDRHPRYQSLLLATGDSGHAFKFLPVMGDLMVQAIEGTLAPHLQHAWSHARPRKEKKEDRGDSVLLPLDLDSLAKGQDLLP